MATWFRRKYNLSPKDPRFLEVTHEDITEDWILEQLEKNPNITYEELTRKSAASDEEWAESVIRENTLNTVKSVFNGKKKEAASAKDEETETLGPKDKIEASPKKDFEVIESETI